MAHKSIRYLFVFFISISPIESTAQLMIRDLDNFIKSYDLINNGADPIFTLKNEYLDNASAGLMSFMERKNLTAESLWKGIQKQPHKYEHLEQLRTTLIKMDGDIQKIFKRLKSIYPATHEPVVYFFVGNMTAGGLNDVNGLLISLEVYNSLAKGQTHNYQLENIPHLIAHELVHYQQLQKLGLEDYKSIYREKKSLLALSIREGIADFIATIISGHHINPEAHAYGDMHENELWSKFSGEMWRVNTGEWMFVNPKDTDMPQDLGYYIGFKIAESFYQNHHDKEKAIAEMIAVTDYADFLQRSKYNPEK